VYILFFDVERSRALSLEPVPVFFSLAGERTFPLSFFLRLLKITFFS